jgi:hypothetical protein
MHAWRLPRDRVGRASWLVDAPKARSAYAEGALRCMPEARAAYAEGALRGMPKARYNSYAEGALRV